MPHRQLLLVQSHGDSTQSAINGSYGVKDEPILPDMVLWIYVATVVVTGVLLSFAVIGALLKCKSNGTSIFIIQLLLNDIISLGIASIELFYMNNRKWTLYPEVCPVYLGLESITSTATVYFIVAINLHAISTHNLAAKTVNRKRQIQIDESSDDDNNYEVAVCTQQRSLTIDYSVSVSIPLVTFASLLPNEKAANICGIQNFNHVTNILLQMFVLLIRILIPSLSVIITAILVACKLFSFKSVRSSVLNESANIALKLGLALSISYVLFSTQRLYGSLLFEIFRKPFMQYKYPVFDKLTSFVFCMINYIAPASRPLVYIFMDKTIRRKIKLCCRNGNVDVR